MPIELLAQWGFLIFLIGVALIFFGLYPYKRLKWKESHPDKLVLSRDEMIRYYLNQKLEWELPLKSIKDIAYREKSNGYGLDLHLYDAKVIFLPFFPESTKDRLEEMDFRTK